MHLFLEIQLEIVYNCQKVVTHPGYLKYGCITVYLKIIIPYPTKFFLKFQYSFGKVHQGKMLTIL